MLGAKRKERRSEGKREKGMRMERGWRTSKGNGKEGWRKELKKGKEGEGIEQGRKEGCRMWKEEGEST